MTEVDKTLEEEDDIDGEDEDEGDEEGLVVVEVAYVEVLGQLFLQLFAPTFWSRWTRWYKPFTWILTILTRSICRSKKYRIIWEFVPRLENFRRF